MTNIFEGIKLNTDKDKNKTNIFSGTTLPGKEYAPFTPEPTMTWGELGNSLWNALNRASAVTVEKMSGVQPVYDKPLPGIVYDEDNYPTSGVEGFDTVATAAGDIAANLAQYAIASHLLGATGIELAKLSPKLAGKVSTLPGQAGLRLGTTRMAKEGLEQLMADEDKTVKDYAKTGISGFVAGETGKLLGEGIRSLSAGRNIPDNIYPWIERGVTGAGVGAAMTGVDYAFDPEETNFADLGINMATMALMYAAPMLSSKNRAEINQARHFLEAQKALTNQAFQRIGKEKPRNLKEMRELREFTHKYQDRIKEFTLSDRFNELDTGQQNALLNELNQVYLALDYAQQYVNNMPLGEKTKAILNSNLKDIFFNSTRDIFNSHNLKYAVDPQDFKIKDYGEALPAGKESAVLESGKVPVGLLTEPAIQLSGEVQSEPILMGGEAQIPPVSEFQPETGQIPEKIDTEGGTITEPLKPQIEGIFEPQKEINPIDRGLTEKVVTPRGTEIETQFEVVDIDDLITSHDVYLKENPQFPKEAQPRERSKAASEEQIHDIYNRLDPERLAENRLAAHGAPIIGSDGVVETGNARTIALKRLYRDNHQNIDNYKEWLINNAERFGLDPEKIRQVDKPILVKERLTDIDRQQFTQEANIEETARMSATEQGLVDAQRMSDEVLNKFVPHEEGIINHAGNREFITQFLNDVVGGSQKGQYIDSSGIVNQEGIKRIEAAIFMKAYNDPELASELLESTDSNIKNITGAMMEAAPKVVDIQRKIEKGNFPDLDISEDLTKAVKLYKRAKATTGDVNKYFNSQSLFGRDFTELAEKIARIFDANSRSRKRIREVIQNYQYGVEGLDIKIDTDSMFDDFVRKPPTKLEMLEAAYRKMARGYKNVNADEIFGEDQDTLFAGQEEQEPESRVIDSFNDTTGEETILESKTSIDKDGSHYVKTTIDDKEVKLYTDTLNPPDFTDYGQIGLELPEIVRIARELNEGKYPHIVKKFRSDATQGRFVAKNDDGTIELRADIFIGPIVETRRLMPKDKDKIMADLEEKYPEEDYKIETFIDKGKEYVRVYKIDPSYAPKVLAHEIGHLNDWMPEKTLKRGNILGRIASLRSYLKHTLDDEELGQLKRDHIMQELKKLSMKWKPFDPNADENYTKYRFSSPELYADAVSVMINNPDMLKEEAPIFHEAFLKYLDKKPEFRAVYDDVQAKMRIRKSLNLDVSEQIREGYMEGVDKRIESMRENIRKPESSKDWLLRGLDSKYHDIYKIIAPYVREKGSKGDIARAVRNEIKELPYMAAEVEDYFHFQVKVLKKLQNAGITLDDISEYAEMKRIITDRQDIANPEGVRPKRALEILDNLKDKLGEARYNMMVDGVEEFIDNRMERIIDRLVEAGIYDENLNEHLQKNRYYFTFNVIKYMDQKHGKGAGAAIMPQYGTLSQVENVIIATLFKDATILNSINVMEAKQALVTAIQHFSPGIIEEAPTDFDKNISKMIPQEPDDDNKDMIQFLINGDLAAYHVPKIIADTFKHEPYTANTLTQIYQTLMSGFKNLTVSRNVGWMIANTPRDFKNTIMNNPEIKIKDIPKVMRYYVPAIKEAWAEVRLEERSEDISDMRRHKMIPVDRVYQTRDTSSYDETTALMEKALIDLEVMPAREFSKPIEAIKKVWDFLGDVGEVTELSSKLAGYKYIRDNIDLATKEIGYRVKERVGTPNFKEQGEWHRLTNNFFVFSTIRKQGWRATFDAYGDDPGTWLWKALMLIITPKLIQIGLENADKIFPESKVAREIAETYDGFSRYLKENYIKIPIFSKGGKSHGISIPQEGPEQLIGNIIYNIAEGDAGGVFDSTIEALPWNISNINPLVKLGIDSFQYLSGENIYDYWKGREIVSEDAMVLGGLDKFGEFALYEFGQFGGSAIVDPSIKYADSEIEALLNIFPFNALGRFYRITDAGHNEDIGKVYDMRDRAHTIVKKYRTEMMIKGQSSISYDEYNKAGEEYSKYNRLTTMFSNMRQAIQAEKDEEKKREIEIEMINLAREALGKLPLTE